MKHAQHLGDRLDRAPHESLIDRYAAGGAILAYAVQGLSGEQKQARPGPGAWSIAEVVAHLVDSDAVACDRMKRIIAEPNPTLLAFDENLWIQRLRSGEMPVEEGVNLFTANRQWMVAGASGLLGGRFRPCRPALRRGRMTLAELLAGFVGHLDHHLKFVYGKRANLGVALQPRYSYLTG